MNWHITLKKYGETTIFLYGRKVIIQYLNISSMDEYYISYNE